MAEAIYSIEALSTGAGRNGHVTTSDGMVDLDMAIPVPMGGSGKGSNPEQLFAAGYAACFHSALQAVARLEKVEIHDTSVGARVDVLRDEAAGMKLAVTLEVVIPDLDHVVAEKLARGAHEMCPYSRATRGNIDVSVVVSDD
jgi:lipoyl-dependent peroxiredoxin